MAEKRNPFEHHHPHHDHGHDHDHDHDHVNPMIDPAQQALADALRVSFSILKIVMLLLLILYLFSNVFSVKTQETAVRLRFGRIVAELQPGGPYFALPYPIEQVIKVPTATRTVVINDQFWFETQKGFANETLDAMEGQAKPLNPERDGSLLTADANIVHTRWTLTYRVNDPGMFLKRMGNSEVADRVVRYAAEQAIVHAVAQLSADDLLKGITNEEVVRRVMGRVLASEAMGAGVSVETVSMTHHTVPLATRDAFRMVLTAESEKGQLIEAAQQERARILGETAGEAHDPLLRLVEQYEQVADADHRDATRAAELNVALEKSFDGLELDNRTVGGKVAETVNQAKTYRTSVVEQVKSEADRFAMLLEEYRRNPRIVESRLWQETREKVLAGDLVETFYVSPGQVYLEMNRDPNVARQREEARLKKEQADRAAGR